MIESLRRRCRWVDPDWLPTPAQGLLDRLPNGYMELLVDPLQLLRSPAPESMIASDAPPVPHVAARWSAFQTAGAASLAGTHRPADVAAAANMSPAGLGPSAGPTARTAQPPLPSLARLPLGAVSGPAPLREARYPDVARFAYERAVRRGELTPLHPLAPNARASDPRVVRSSPRDLVNMAAVPAAPVPILPEGSASGATAARAVIAPAHRLAPATGLATPPRESDPSPVRLTRDGGQLASVLASNLHSRNPGGDSNGEVERPVQALRRPTSAHLREPALSMQTAPEPAPAEDTDRPLAAGPVQAASRLDIRVITPDLVEALMEALADELRFEFLRTYGTVR